MKKILVLHTKYRSFGGEDQSVENEIKLLEKYFDINKVFLSNKLEKKFNDLITLLFNRNLNLEKKFQKLINEFSPDFIYVHNTWFKASVGLFKLLKNYEIPVYIKLHNFRYYCTKSYLLSNHLNGSVTCNACGISSKGKKKFNKYFEDSYFKSFLVNKFGKKYFKVLQEYEINIIALTKFHKKFLIEQGIKEEKITVIPNFIPIRNSKKDKNQNDFFIYAGRISSEKGVDKLIESFQNANLHNIKLKIVGEGPQLSFLKNKYLKSKNIQFLGFVKNKDVLDLISNSIAVVTATKLYEGQPTLLCEASSLGVPSIFPETGGISEFFPNNYHFSYKQFDYEDLTLKIQLINNKNNQFETGLENKKFLNRIVGEKELTNLFYGIFK
tara:strand:- start:119 stop:1267 length:1149 start_codon:yes stop_codon:yes gene_type:complete